MQEYIVQPDDTLSSIAEKKLGNANRWAEIARLNNLTNPHLLFVGQKLKLPIPNPVKLIPVSGPLNAQGASITPARGFMFIVFEQLPEVGGGKVIRKVEVVPLNYALNPGNLLANVSPAEHAMAVRDSNSQFLSASNRSFGAANFNGEPLIIDLAKIQKAGGRIITLPELVKDLERFIAENPKARVQVERLISTVRDIEGEVLIEGSTPPNSATRPGPAHNPYIKSAEQLWQGHKKGKITRAQLIDELAKLEKSYRQARILGNVGRVLMVAGVIVTAYDLTVATQQSLKFQSFRPIGAEVVRQGAGWGSAIAGGKIGFTVGAYFGIELGPGAIITGAIGAIVFGAIGYLSADWLADNYVFKN